MKVQKRLLYSTIFLMVLLCFTFRAVNPTRVVHREKVKKEKAVVEIIDYLRNGNAELKDEKLKSISEAVYDESTRYNLDYRLVLAIMKVESNFRYDAVSAKGARGLLQVKPSLARYIAEDVGVTWQGANTLDEPEKNIKIGVHLFSQLLKDFQNIHMALHAYHVGPARLREILTEKKIPQKRYLNLVLDEYDRNISILPAPQYQ
jgi:soluble lytic murein transglycosylase